MTNIFDKLLRCNLIFQSGVKREDFNGAQLMLQEPKGQTWTTTTKQFGVKQRKHNILPYTYVYT